MDNTQDRDHGLLTLPIECVLMSLKSVSQERKKTKQNCSQQKVKGIATAILTDRVMNYYPFYISIKKNLAGSYSLSLSIKTFCARCSVLHNTDIHLVTS